MDLFLKILGENLKDKKSCFYKDAQKYIFKHLKFKDQKECFSYIRNIDKIIDKHFTKEQWFEFGCLFFKIW